MIYLEKSNSLYDISRQTNESILAGKTPKCDCRKNPAIRPGKQTMPEKLGWWCNADAFGIGWCF